MSDSATRDDEWTKLIARSDLQSASTRLRPHLLWMDGGQPHDMALTDRTVIGSSPNAAITVADRSISRLHAELEIDRDGVWIRDLGSTNGTWVEGIRVTRALVPNGGRVHLGQTTFTLQVAPTPTRVPLWPHDRFGPLVGRSEPMRELFMRLMQYSSSSATVLVQGETGTGKELVARAIHEASDRADRPFVVVDCGALPETLLETELFGHARGAFTGATHARVGAIEAAEGGTLFLDEVGELPLALQPKLLRAIEAKTIRRVGETEHRDVDVRFVAATHRDLQSMVSAGAFREDLYFRLSVLPVVVPALRARTDDIPHLLQHFLAGRASPPSAEALAALVAHPWLGNVRELRNFAERVVVLGEGEAWSLTRSAERDAAATTNDLATESAATTDDLPPVRTDVPFKELRERWLDHLERGYMEALIHAHSRNVTAIAEAAGLDRTYVHRILRKHDL